MGKDEKLIRELHHEIFNIKLECKKLKKENTKLKWVYEKMLQFKKLS